MWAKLKAVYEHQSAISVHLLQQKFFNMGYTNCTVAEFVSQLEEIQQQLKHLGEELSDAMLIPKVLMALTEVKVQDKVAVIIAIIVRKRDIPGIIVATETKTGKMEMEQDLVVIFPMHL